jgi:hypothetical protein
MAFSIVPISPAPDRSLHLGAAGSPHCAPAARPILLAALLCAPALAAADGAAIEGGVLTRFQDRPALLAHAGTTPLTSEAFGRSFVLANNVSECFQALSHNSDDPCLAPDAVASGFAVRTRLGSVFFEGFDIDLVMLGAGFLGVPVHAVGNNVISGPVDNPTVIDFQPPVTLVGMDLHEPIISGAVAIRAFGADDQDLGGFQVEMVGTSGFAGFASSAPVSRVELQTVAQDGGELFSGLLFGGGAGQLRGPDAVDFGVLTVGSQAAVDIELSNDGGLDLPVPVVGGLGGLPAQFTVLADACSGAVVPAGASCLLRLAFVPGHAGVVTYDLALSPVADTAIRLRGEGRTPRLASVPGHLDFGQVAPGASSAPQTLTLSNLTGAVVAGQLPQLPAVLTRVGGDCPPGAIVLAPGEHCSLDLVFAPSTPGPFDAELVLQSGSHAAARTTVSGLAGGAP